MTRVTTFTLKYDLGQFLTRTTIHHGIMTLITVQLRIIARTKSLTWNLAQGVKMQKKKDRDLTQPFANSTYTLRKIQKATWQHKNATKNLDYATIADWLRTVSWSNSSHPTGVIKPVYGNPTWHSGTWPYTVTPSNDQTLHQFVNLLPNWTLLPILTL